MWRKGSLYALLLGMSICIAAMENSMDTPQKLKKRMTLTLWNATPRYLTTENEILIRKDTNTLC